MPPPPPAYTPPPAPTAAGSPGPGYGQAPTYASPGYSAAPQNGAGTAALICGILGLLCCGILSIVAIITGVRGKRLAEQGLATNGGSAKAGLILGWIGIALWILGVAGYIALLATGNHFSSNLPTSY